MAEQQLKSHATSLQSLEQQISILRKENMALADQVLDKDAEIFTLKGKLEATNIEHEQQSKLEHLQAQLEVELQKRQLLEVELKLQITQLEKCHSDLLIESQLYQQQLQTAKEESTAAYQTFNEYKLRAQRILQV